MQDNPFVAIGLPISLFIIMVGMGLSLTLADFKRVGEQPRSVAVGTIAQLALIPLLGFAVAYAFGLGGLLAVGIVLIAALPGGTTSNMLTYLSKGNLALSITLTVIASFATIAPRRFILMKHCNGSRAKAVILAWIS